MGEVVGIIPPGSLQSYLVCLLISRTGPCTAGARTVAIRQYIQKTTSTPV